ncbi:MAG: prepilin-type N-terminal cleavage/methylation domain-containing protein [Phycisphaerales bacterium]
MVRRTEHLGFTLVELLVVIVVISILSATVAVAAARGSLEQRTTTTVQILSEVRSSIALHRVGATIEGTDPFPVLAQINDGAMFPAGILPPCPFTGDSGAAGAGDLGAAQSRTLAASGVGWVYHATSGPLPVAIFYANSDTQTDRTDPETGVATRASGL